MFFNQPKFTITLILKQFKISVFSQNQKLILELTPLPRDIDCIVYMSIVKQIEVQICDKVKKVNNVLQCVTINAMVTSLPLAQLVRVRSPVLSSPWMRIFRGFFLNCSGLVAQAVRRSPPTAGVPSSRLGPSMWVSWWTKRGLGRFFSGFSRFPYHKFHSTISALSFHPFRFISSALVMVR